MNFWMKETSTIKPQLIASWATDLFDITEGKNLNDESPVPDHATN